MVSYEPSTVLTIEVLLIIHVKTMLIFGSSIACIVAQIEDQKREHIYPRDNQAIFNIHEVILL